MEREDNQACFIAFGASRAKRVMMGICGAMDATKVRNYWGKITYVHMLTDEILTRITET